jgi:hypothetical protein
MVGSTAQKVGGTVLRVVFTEQILRSTEH